MKNPTTDYQWYRYGRFLLWEERCICRWSLLDERSFEELEPCCMECAHSFLISFRALLLGQKSSSLPKNRSSSWIIINNRPTITLTEGIAKRSCPHEKTTYLPSKYTPLVICTLLDNPSKKKIIISSILFYKRSFSNPYSTDKIIFLDKVGFRCPFPLVISPKSWPC